MEIHGSKGGWQPLAVSWQFWPTVLRDPLVPANLWMMKRRRALAMWLKPTMKSVHIDLRHSNRDIAGNLLAVRWTQQHLLRNPVPICANKLTAWAC
jgi:hypothetical protein